MNEPNTPVPFDPDFDGAPAPAPNTARTYFIFGVIAGIGAAAILGIIFLLT